MPTDKEQDYQSYQHDSHDKTTEEFRAVEDELSRDNGSHRPTRSLDRCIVDVELCAVAVDGLHTRFAVYHLIAYLIINRVVCLLCIDKVGLVQDSGTHGMGNISAALTDDIGICMIIEEGAVALHDSPLALLHATILGFQHPLIEIEVALLQKFCEPLQRHVGRDNGIEIARCII